MSSEGECFADAQDRRARYVQAEILDRSGRVIAVGAATPAADGASAVFHVDYPEQVDRIATNAAFLRRKGGSIEGILSCMQCPHSNNAMHLHIETLR